MEFAPSLQDIVNSDVTERACRESEESEYHPLPFIADISKSVPSIEGNTRSGILSPASTLMNYGAESGVEMLQTSVNCQLFASHLLRFSTLDKCRMASTILPPLSPMT